MPAPREVATSPAAQRSSQKEVTTPFGLGQIAATGRAQAAPASSSPISKRTIALVQQSWAQVMPISDAASSLFYARLFTLDPSLRAMFKSDMTEQKKKLMQTLSVAVDGLSNLPKLVPALQALGERHAGYMVVDEHYDLVGDALLWTLREGLGDSFTGEIEAAWKEVYAVVADTMKKAVAAGAEAKGAAARAAAPAAAAKPAAPAQAAVKPVSPTMPAPAARPAAPAAKAAEAAPGSPISKRTIALVQQSWAQVMPISDAAASLFYDRLFTLDPSLRAMFKSDMAEQKKKLMQTLSVAVDGLSNLPKLVPVLQALGERHAGYMVLDEHYDLVGEALLWTLHEGLGDAFNAEVEAAWKEVYGVVAGTMKKAAAAAGGPRAPAPAAKAAPAEEDMETLHYAPSSREPLDAVQAAAAPDPTATLRQASPADPPARRPTYLQSAPEPPPKPLPAAGNGAGPRDTAPLPREPEPARPPSPALAATAILPAAAAREVEPQRPASVLLPLGGQDVSFHVQVKLDVSPVVEALAARAAQQPAQGGLLPALLLALLCLVAAGATGAAVALGGGASAGLLVGAPLGAALLAVAAFGLGLMSGRCRAAGDNKGGRG